MGKKSFPYVSFVVLCVLTLFYVAPVSARSHEVKKSSAPTRPAPRPADSLLVEQKRIILEYALFPVFTACLASAYDQSALGLCLLDPYFKILTPSERMEFLEQKSGRYSGIGARLGRAAERVVVEAVEPDSPASLFFKKDDMILEVDGYDVSGWDQFSVADMIRGDPKSVVAIAVEREGKKLLPFLVERREVAVSTVDVREIDASLVVVRVTAFNDDTSRQLFRALVRLHDRDPLPRLVLDLQNNPGGSLDTVIAILKFFAAHEDDLLLTIHGWRLAPESIIAASRRRQDDEGPLGAFRDFPLIAWVNNRTGSGAEILAAYLQQDCGRLVVGASKTAGKDTAWSVFPLSDGGGVRLTTGRYFVGKRLVSVAGGIEPDVSLDMLIPEAGASPEEIERFKNTVAPLFDSAAYAQSKK